MGTFDTVEEAHAAYCKQAAEVRAIVARCQRKHLDVEWHCCLLQASCRSLSGEWHYDQLPTVSTQGVGFFLYVHRHAASPSLSRIGTAPNRDDGGHQQQPESSPTQPRPA